MAPPATAIPSRQCRRVTIAPLAVPFNARPRATVPPSARGQLRRGGDLFALALFLRRACFSTRVLSCLLPNTEYPVRSTFGTKNPRPHLCVPNHARRNGTHHANLLKPRQLLNSQRSLKRNFHRSPAAGIAGISDGKTLLTRPLRLGANPFWERGPRGDCGSFHSRRSLRRTGARL